MPNFDSWSAEHIQNCIDYSKRLLSGLNEWYGMLGRHIMEPQETQNDRVAFVKFMRDTEKKLEEINRDLYRADQNFVTAVESGSKPSYAYESKKLMVKEDDDLDADTDNMEESFVRNEFLYAFCVTKNIVFEVNYYTLGSNERPYFSTSACEFNRQKTDWTSCGQAQDRILPPGAAKRFYKKWDKLHLKDLTDSEYEELVSDIDELKRAYPYYVGYEFDGKATRKNISFYEIRKKSMEMPRTRR